MPLDYEVKAVRLVPSEDQSHMHIELVGYESAHMPGEQITIEIPRVIQKMAFEEKFHVMAGGERAEVKAGKCPVCSHEPYLVTDKDSADRQILFTLPQE